jgi:hypothetical protein
VPAPRFGAIEQRFELPLGQLAELAEAADPEIVSGDGPELGPVELDFGACCAWSFEGSEASSGFPVSTFLSMSRKSFALSLERKSG